MIFTLFRDRHVRWALTILLILAGLALSLSHARTVLAFEAGDSLPTCLSPKVDPTTGQAQLDCGLCSGAMACLGVDAGAALATAAPALGPKAPAIWAPAETGQPRKWSRPISRGPPVVS